LPGAGQPQNHGQGTYRVVFSFGENPYGYDGAGPVASLINLNGTFYGTTSGGGTHTCTASGVECGTVFGLSTTGLEHVLHDFSGTPDGNFPFAGLVAMNGTLYGTTANGGTYGYGTVFSISTSGTETVLHSFGYGSDGAQPMAALTAVHGNLYGTTLYGGDVACSPSTDGCGTVFRISPSGKERVLHIFSGKSDGLYPAAGLLNLKGTLYGTTEFGDNGGGTVFTITPAGKETVLYNFPEVANGTAPEAALIDVKGTLYGTTEGGGSADWGTVFRISKTGTDERVLHSFNDNGSDGYRPDSGLVALKGLLYGTTPKGGIATVGTLFSVDAKTGAETILHNFNIGYRNDGVAPDAGLINLNGTLYGTTSYGGVSLPSCPNSGPCDWGTVFAFKP
jgi:uncharacterized repeat protein (TIGR03803 family)